MASALFIPTDDEERRERILDSMSSAPHHVMVSAMEGLRDYDAATAAGSLAVPGLYSGKFCQLEVPEQVNAMIERFLAVLLPGPPARAPSN